LWNSSANIWQQTGESELIFMCREILFAGNPKSGWEMSRIKHIMQNQPDGSRLFEQIKKFIFRLNFIA
jgi:hypothetical protein